MTELCGTCRWCERPGPDDMGLCHYNPPAWPRGGNPTDGAWPGVSLINGWCSKHEPKEAGISFEEVHGILKPDATHDALPAGTIKRVYPAFTEDGLEIRDKPSATNDALPDDTA